MKTPTSDDYSRWRKAIDAAMRNSDSSKHYLKEIQNELLDLWLGALRAEQDVETRQPSPTTTLNGMPSHCPACKAEYQHIANPRSGASMMVVCKCKPRYIDAGNGNTIIVMETPRKEPCGTCGLLTRVGVKTNELCPGCELPASQ